MSKLEVRPMRIRHVRRRRFGVVAAALVLATLPLAGRTVAYHDVYFGSSYISGGVQRYCDETVFSQCVANDASHFYGLIDLSTSRAAATTRALATLYGPNSDINVFTSNSSDLRVYETYSMVDAFAWGTCAVGATKGGSDAAHTRWCQPQNIYWQTHPNAANKVNTTAKYNYIGCHEVGHTVGLRHRSGSPSTCMIATSKPPSDPTAVVPSIDYNASADYSRINDHY